MAQKVPRAWKGGEFFLAEIVSQSFLLNNDDELLSIAGRFDQHLNILEKNFNVRVIPKGNELIIEGEKEDVEKLFSLLNTLLGIIRKGFYITARDFSYAVKLTKEGEADAVAGIFTDVVIVTDRGKQIKPKTIGQKSYLEAMRSHDIVFSIGPAGTGKTYLALSMAIDALNKKNIQRIILTRPAVEAGEHLGFLPGDFQEKVDPYLRPLYDGLYDLIGPELFGKYKEKGIIEVAPLAYMRGRTLDDAYIILDEAQNATPEQMKMFLTRMGFNSRAVITGDITQVDLPKGRFSGLIQAPGVLKNIEGIAIVYLTEKDVVRHPLVQKIIKAYERYESKKK